jgi:hypothetical protein
MIFPRSLRIAVVLGPLLIGIDAARAAPVPLKRLSRPEWLLQIPDAMLPRLPERIHLLPPEQVSWVASSADLPARRKKRSHEWRLLPGPQAWEYAVEKTPPPKVDSSGFEIGAKVGKLASDRTIASFAIAPDRLAVSGEIINARTLFSQIGLGDPVFIRAEDQLQVGTVYSVTNGPEKISSSRDGRVGFVYPILGKIKIIGVRDGMFIGTIIDLREPMYRGNLLIPEVDDLRFPSPVTSPTPLKASVLVPKGEQESLIGQHSVVFLDIGSAEGLAPGMILRSYLKEDPHTGERLPTRDFMIESEIQVLSVQDQFSVAMVIQSRAGIRNGTEVVSITDLKDFERNQGLEGIIQDRPKETRLNDLDSFDRTDGLGEKESQDLKQLENWKKPEAAPGPGPGLSPEDVKKERVTPESSPPPDLGAETAPDDGSGNLEPSPPPAPAPEGTPETAPEPLPPSVEPTPAPPKEDADEDSGDADDEESGF